MKRIIAVWLAVLLTATVVDAFNLSPFTWKIRARDNAADSAFGVADTFHVELFSTIKAVKVKATQKIITDTLEGSASSVAIIDDTLWLNRDSTNCVMVVWFAGTGAGIKYNCSTDSLYWTRNGSTWVQFGTGGTSGSSTTNADSLGHVVFKPRVKTDGYVIKYDSDGDSLYLSADATGAAGDSNAIVYETDRLATYTDSGLFLGDVGDSTMLWYDLTADNIKAYVILYYVDDISDSALMSKYSIETTIGDSLTANGFITGINSGMGLSGGASQGVATLQLDGAHFAIGQSGGAGYDTVKVFADGNDGGKIIFTVSGSPPDYYEMMIEENNITFHTGTYLNGLTGTDLTIADGYRKSAVPDSAYPTVGRVNSLIAASPAGDITSVALGNGGNGDGASGAVTLNVVAGTSTGLAVNADSVYLVWTWLYSFIDTTHAVIDSTVGAARASRLIAGQGSANTAGRLVADSIDVDTLSTSRLSFDAGGAFTSLLGDGLTNTAGALTASLGTAIVTGEITDGTILWADLDSALSVKQYVRAIFQDSMTNELTLNRTISGNWVNTANPWADNEVADNITVTGMGDLTDVVAGAGMTGSSLTGPSPTLNVIGSDEITVAADSIFVADSKIKSVHIADYSLVPADLDSNGDYVSRDLRVNGKLTVDTINGGQGLIIGSSITLGTDITDDSLVVEWNPEYPNMVLYRGFSAPDTNTFNSKTSFKIYGGSDSTDGNFIIFHDSTMASDTARRHIVIEIPVPDRVDSLRRVTVQCMSRQYTSTSDEFFLRAKLHSAPITWSRIDSLSGGSVLDCDSSAAASLTTLHLNPASGNWAATPFTSKYLLITGRKDVGTAFQWAKIYKIQMVWSRTRL